MAGVEVTWKGTEKDRVETSAEEAKVWVAEAPGMVVPSRARLMVRIAGMEEPASVVTVLWKDA